MFIIRLDLDETSAKTRKHQFCNATLAIKSSFAIKTNLLEASLKTQPEDRYQFIPQFATHKDILPKRDSIHKTTNYDKLSLFCDSPHNFARFDLKFYPRIRAACSHKRKA